MIVLDTQVCYFHFIIDFFTHFSPFRDGFNSEEKFAEKRRKAKFSKVKLEISTVKLLAYTSKSISDWFHHKLLQSHIALNQNINAVLILHSSLFHIIVNFYMNLAIVESINVRTIFEV